MVLTCFLHLNRYFSSLFGCIHKVISSNLSSAQERSFGESNEIAYVTCISLFRTLLRWTASS